MTRFFFGLLLVFALSACGGMPATTAAPAGDSGEEAFGSTLTPAAEMESEAELEGQQEIVDRMKALCCESGWIQHLYAAENEMDTSGERGQEMATGAVFLEKLETAGERFDVNRYFEVLTHLEPEQGYELDYAYFAAGGDGFSIVFAKPIADQDEGQLPDNVKIENGDYLNQIRVDGSPEGYFELVLLSIMGEQFYQAWHAEYNDWEVVASPERLQEIVEMLDEVYRSLEDEQKKAVRQLDVTTRVKFDGDKVYVRVLVFSKWGGFYERIYTVERDFPHRMTFEKSELVPYDCGIMF
jgi:hypothetical protein